MAARTGADGRRPSRADGGGGERTCGRGFAAETGVDGLERARAKRTSKEVDLLVYNDVGDPDIGFESSENGGDPLRRGRAIREARAQERIAAEILDDVERLLEARWSDRLRNGHSPSRRRGDALSRVTSNVGRVVHAPEERSD